MENITLGNYKLISFDKIPSTQNYALELVATGKAVDKTIVLAEMQTSGRGRYKRQWVSNAGNLYASFIYSVNDRDPRLSYSVAVALAETLIHFGLNPKIKWPNDILISDKKISGILIEYAKDFVIIGIGINIKSNPDVSEYKTEKVAKYSNAGRDDILTILTKKMDVWLNMDFAAVRERWMELAAMLNNVVKYKGQSAQLIGINEDGALVLRKDSKYIMTYGDEISL